MPYAERVSDDPQASTEPEHGDSPGIDAAKGAS